MKKIAKGSSKELTLLPKQTAYLLNLEEFNEDALNIKDVEITYRLLMSDAPLEKS